MARKKTKKEKYITLRTSRAGTESYEICIRMNDQVYRKSIVVKDFDSRSDALKFACNLRDKTLVQMNSGYTVSKYKTVKEIYEKSKELFPARIKTVIRHDAFYRQGIKQYEDVSIEKITSADIQTSINKYAKTHTHIQTEHLLAIWRKIYKTAVMMNISIPDRTIPVIIPECKADTPRKKEISPEDLETFLDTLLGYNSANASGAYQSRCIYYAVQIMRYCGLRPAECFALTKDDIFLNGNNSGFISVNKAARSTVDSALEISGTKTKKSTRLVPIPVQLAPIIKECLEWSKYDLIFADSHGRLQSIDKVSDYIRNVAKKAKVQFNLYMLRHQLSTDLFSNGTPANIIRDIMGHESASMSLDYAVSNEKDRVKAMNNRMVS